MDTVIISLKQAIINVLEDYINFLKNDTDTKAQLIIDEKNDRYLLIEMGWQDHRRIYGVLIHMDIIDQKIWIQQDGTEDGVASELVALGIPKQQIVLGFKSENRRRITEFAVS
jgi:hypothetical protein